MSASLARARRGFGTRYPLLVGDRRLSDRASSEVRYPAEPATIVGHVAQAAPGDVDAAVTAAREACWDWRDLPGYERADIINRAARLMEHARFDLAATMVFESAKPWYEADGDVCEAIDYLRYYAAEGERLSEPQPLGDTPGEHNEYFHESRGVTAVIAPWNFPLAIITGMSVGALAGGNTAILKPAAQSPIIAYRLLEILRDAGIPHGAVQYLPGPGSELGRALVQHPGGDHSAFTRLMLVGSAYGEALERLKNAVASLVVGLPDDPATFVPPVIRAEARDKICGYVESGRMQATMLVQADISHLNTSRARDAAYYVAPTVFTDVPLDSPLAQEEIFGPVLSVFRAVDFEEALEIALDSRFALTGGVFSRNPRHIDLARVAFRTGNLYINRKITGAIVGRQPFGGLAMSGAGEKAGGPDYVRQFMQARVVSENTMRRGFAPEDGA